jgi:hypothetical protein
LFATLADEADLAYAENSFRSASGARRKNHAPVRGFGYLFRNITCAQKALRSLIGSFEKLRIERVASAISCTTDDLVKIADGS